MIKFRQGFGELNTANFPRDLSSSAFKRVLWLCRGIIPFSYSLKLHLYG